jgi:hypothetical protein
MVRENTLTSENGWSLVIYCCFAFALRYYGWYHYEVLRMFDLSGDRSLEEMGNESPDPLQ